MYTERDCLGLRCGCDGMEPLQSNTEHNWVTTAHHSWTPQCPPQLDIHCLSQLDAHLSPQLDLPVSTTAGYPLPITTAHHSCVLPAHHQPFPKSQGTFRGCHPCAQHMYRCSGCPSLAEPSPGSGEICTGGWLGSGSLSHHEVLSPGAAGSSLNAAFKRQQELHCDAFIFTKRKLLSPVGWCGAGPVGCRGRQGQGTWVYLGLSQPTRAGAVQGTQYPPAATVEIPIPHPCTPCILT